MYGKVEVKAKLPLGDWLWPAIWLLPKRSKYNDDIYNCLHKVLYFTLFYLGTGSGRPAVRLTSWRAGATWTTPITGSTSGWNSLGPLCSMAAVIRWTATRRPIATGTPPRDRVCTWTTTPMGWTGLPPTWPSGCNIYVKRKKVKRKNVAPFLYNFENILNFQLWWSGVLQGWASPAGLV